MYVRSNGGWVEMPSSFEAVVVDELPEASEDTTGKMYLLRKTDEETGDEYCEEYITIENEGVYRWEQIGETKIDLTNYYTKEETEELLGEVEETVSEAMTLKQDKLTAGENITIEDNVISATGGGVEVITLDTTDPASMQAAYLAVYTAFVNGTGIPQIRMATSGYIFDVKILAEKDGVLFAEAMLYTTVNDSDFKKCKLILSPTEGLKAINDNIIFSAESGLPDWFTGQLNGSIIALNDLGDIDRSGAYVYENGEWKKLKGNGVGEEELSETEEVGANAFAALNKKVDDNNEVMGSILPAAKNYADGKDGLVRRDYEKAVTEDEKIGAAGIYYSVKSYDDTIKNCISIT